MIAPAAAPVAARWRGARGVCAVLVVVAAVLVRLWPLLDPDQTFLHHDWYQVHQPDAEHVVQAVRDGSFVPLWSQYLLGGAPLYGVATKPLSYPPFLLVVPLTGATLGMNLLGLLHPLLAAVGMLLLARRLGCGPAAGATGAILLACGMWPGSVFKSQPFWGYAVAWWPWAMWAVIDVLDAGEWRAVLGGALWLAVFMALQVLAGGVFQVYWLTCFLAAFCLVFLVRRGDGVGAGRRIAALLLAGALCGLLAGVKILPALEWMHTSGRSEGLTSDDIVAGYSARAEIGGEHISVVLLKDLFLGEGRVGTASTVVGLLAGLFFAARRRVTWAGAAGVLVCLVIGTSLIHEQLVEWLPGYDRMRFPHRFLNAAGLGMALLAALGVEGLLRRLPRALAGAAVVLGAGLLLADLRLLPGLLWQRQPSSSVSEVRELAAPVLAALAQEPGSRFLSPTSRFQALWVERGLRSTAGVLGGAGAISPAYTEWLPPDLSPQQLELQARGALDVLSVRFTASYVPLRLSWLAPVFEPREPRAPSDAFVARVRADGTALDWSGYVGGVGAEEGAGLAPGPDGSVWVAGSTTTNDATFAEADQHAAGLTDMFAARLDPDGHLLGAQLAGSPHEDVPHDIATRADGTGFIAGSTAPQLAGPAKPRASRDACVARVPPDGSPLLPASPPAFVGPMPGPEPFVLQDAGALLAFDGRGLLVLRPLEPEADTSDVAAVRLAFAGASAATPGGCNARPGRVHQLVGPPSGWRRDIATWSGLALPGLWPGIDVAFDSEEGFLVLTATCAPGADRRQLCLRVEGASAAVDAAGRLVVETGAEPLRFDRPLGQVPGRSQVARTGTWELEQDAQGRTLARPVVASPPGAGLVLVTRLRLAGAELGGVFGDDAEAVAVDPSGDALVAGRTFSWGLWPRGEWPEPGTTGPAGRADSDAFVARLDGTSGELLWYTLLGGPGDDDARGLALDPQGRAYVAGSTRSDMAFPVVGALGRQPGGGEDAWAARLTADGTSLEWCGLVGGSGDERAEALALDADGRTWIAGSTRSDESTLPLRGGPGSTFAGRSDAFVGRIAPDGASLELLGLLGGDGFDGATAVAPLPDGGAWLCGDTTSTEATFPVSSGPGLQASGGWDAFVARLDADGALRSCGFVGGAEMDAARGLLALPSDDVLLSGTTRSDESSFPVHGGLGATMGRDPYETFLLQGASNPYGTDYRRPYVYRRAMALEHVSLAERVVLVCGAEAARSAALHAALARHTFDARRTVFVEDPACDPTALSAPDLQAFAAVLLADAQPDSPAAQLLVKRAGGQLLPQAEGVVLWVPGESGDAGLVAVEEARVQSRANSLSIELPQPAAPYLLVSETFTLHPGWSASIDGRPAPLLRADGCITALRLPAGAQRVEFSYSPPGFRTGLALSVAGALLLGVLAVVRRRGLSISRRLVAER